MRTFSSALLAATALCTVAAPAFAKDHTDKLGKGDYYELIFPEEKILAQVFPEVKKDVIPVTTRDFDVQQILDTSCREQLPKQAPGMLKDVFLYSVRTVPGGFAGGYLGALAGGLAPKGSYLNNTDYMLNSGIQVTFGAIGAGINASEMAKHTDVAGCMAGFVQRAQNAGYLNRNIVIAYNVHPARGHGVRKSSFAAPASDKPAELQPAAPADQANNRPPGIR